MVTVKVTEVRGSGYTLELPWGKFPLEVGGSVDVTFEDMAAVNTHLRPLVAEEVLAWVLLPGSDGY